MGHTFRQRELLERALTHSSLAQEKGERERDNERLEFLGDAVLDLVISELLMERHSSAAEGWLSRARAAAVNKRALAVRARSLELQRWLRLGRSERSSGGEAKASILASALEAVIGALYLDAGLPAVRALVAREFGGELDEPAGAGGDAKTLLQEHFQARGEPVPTYTTTSEEGPPHARTFEVQVRAQGRVLGSGAGTSKRAAEQAAARVALEQLEQGAT